MTSNDAWMDAKFVVTLIAECRLDKFTGIQSSSDRLLAILGRLHGEQNYHDSLTAYLSFLHEDLFEETDSLICDHELGYVDNFHASGRACCWLRYLTDVALEDPALRREIGYVNVDGIYLPLREGILGECLIGGMDSGDGELICDGGGRVGVRRIPGYPHASHRVETREKGVRSLLKKGKWSFLALSPDAKMEVSSKAEARGRFELDGVAASTNGERSRLKQHN